MAKQTVDITSQCNKLISEIKSGIFHPIYLLMGEEAYYTDLICKEIIDNCIDEASRDFNQIICYGADVTADSVISAARHFPMMSDRTLVVLKEAQMCKTLENLSVYCDNPLESTVLVIHMHGASADKRKALYKAVSKKGVVVDSPLIRDYELPRWIENYYRSCGLQLEPGGANLMAEFIGCNLSAVVLETDKLLKNIEQGRTQISIKDIEQNIGVSRQFSVFELTKALSYKRADQALKIATHMANSAKFVLPPAISVLFATFSKVLKYEAAMMRGRVTPEIKAAALAGVNPYFYKDYDAAVQNYPLNKCMSIISLLNEYDYKGKGGDGIESSQGNLFIELIVKILSI